MLQNDDVCVCVRALRMGGCFDGVIRKGLSEEVTIKLRPEGCEGVSSILQPLLVYTSSIRCRLLVGSCYTFLLLHCAQHSAGSKINAQCFL